MSCNKPVEVPGSGVTFLTCEGELFHKGPHWNEESPYSKKKRLDWEKAQPQPLPPEPESEPESEPVNMGSLAAIYDMIDGEIAHLILIRENIGNLMAVPQSQPSPPPPPPPVASTTDGTESWQAKFDALYGNKPSADSY